MDGQRFQPVAGSGITAIEVGRDPSGPFGLVGVGLYGISLVGIGVCFRTGWGRSEEGFCTT